MTPGSNTPKSRISGIVNSSYAITDYIFSGTKQQNENRPLLAGRIKSNHGSVETKKKTLPLTNDNVSRHNQEVQEDNALIETKIEPSIFAQIMGWRIAQRQEQNTTSEINAKSDDVETDFPDMPDIDLAKEQTAKLKYAREDQSFRKFLENRNGNIDILDDASEDNEDVSLVPGISRIDEGTAEITTDSTYRQRAGRRRPTRYERELRRQEALKTGTLLTKNQRKAQLTAPKDDKETDYPEDAPHQFSKNGCRYKYDFQGGVGPNPLAPNGVFFSMPSKDTIERDPITKEVKVKPEKRWWQYFNGTKTVGTTTADSLPSIIRTRRPGCAKIVQSKPQYYQMTGSKLSLSEAERMQDDTERRIVVTESKPLALQLEENRRYGHYITETLPEYYSQLSEIQRTASDKWNENQEQYKEVGLEDASRYENLARNLYCFSSLLSQNPENSPLCLELMEAFKVDNNPHCAMDMLEDSIQTLDEGQEITLATGGNFGAGLGLGLPGPLSKAAAQIAPEVLSIVPKNFFECNGTHDRNAELVFTKRGQKFHIRFRNSIGASLDALFSPYSINMAPILKDFPQFAKDGVLHIPPSEKNTPDALSCTLRVQAMINAKYVESHSQMETFMIDQTDIAPLIDSIKNNKMDDMLKLVVGGIHTSKGKVIDKNIGAAAAVEARLYPTTFSTPASVRTSLGMKGSVDILSSHHAERDNTDPNAKVEQDKSSKTESHQVTWLPKMTIQEQKKVVLSFSTLPHLIPGVSPYTREQTHATNQKLTGQESHYANKTTIGTNETAPKISDIEISDIEIGDSKTANIENVPYQQIVYSFSSDSLKIQLSLLEEAIEKDIETPSSDIEKLAVILKSHPNKTNAIMSAEFRKIDPVLQCAAFMIAQEKEKKIATTLSNSRTNEWKQTELKALFEHLSEKLKYDKVEVVVHSYPEIQQSEIVQFEFKKSSRFTSTFTQPLPALIGIMRQSFGVTDNITAIPEDTTGARNDNILSSEVTIPFMDKGTNPAYRYGANV